MAAQTKVSPTARIAVRIAATVSGLALLSASARASATAIAAKCSVFTAVASTVGSTVFHSCAIFDVVAGLSAGAGRGLELCFLGDVVRALDFLQFSGAIWQILELAGRVAGQSVVTHLIASVVGLFS